MSCPICEKRKPSRFCPAKGETICAICCGTGREVTIDCPADCAHLIAARRYEQEHRKPLTPDAVPYPDARVPASLVEEHARVVSALGAAIVKFARENPGVVDQEVLEALAALAETHRTLGSGIIYEKPPQGALAHNLYRTLENFLAEIRKDETGRGGIPAVHEPEVFLLLVFLLRVGRHWTNGRPRSRAFLDSMRGQFPQAAKEEPRIIIP